MASCTDLVCEEVDRRLAARWTTAGHILAEIGRNRCIQVLVFSLSQLHPMNNADHCWTKKHPTPAGRWPTPECGPCNRVKVNKQHRQIEAFSTSGSCRLYPARSDLNTSRIHHPVLSCHGGYLGFGGINQAVSEPFKIMYLLVGCLVRAGLHLSGALRYKVCAGTSSTLAQLSRNHFLVQPYKAM